MKKQNIVITNKKKVCCEETEGEFGHPKIYLEIKEKQIACPYCNKIFQFKKDK